MSESDSEESIYDYEAKGPSTSKPTVNKNTKVKQRICASESSKQSQKQAVLSDGHKATKQRHVKDKVFLLGDSQLHRIDEEKLSSRNVKTLVRSKGGLKVENVCDNFKDILHKEPKEIILHVGVNNIKKDEEDEILRNYEELGKSINCSLTISGILCGRDKPVLIKKIERVNGRLKTLCSKNGYDFIDNSDVVFRHIGHDGLHLG